MPKTSRALVETITLTADIEVEKVHGTAPCEGYFIHETEGLWPLHFKHSHWWERWSRSNFGSHYAWGTKHVSECKMDVKPTCIPTCHQMDHASWSLGPFSKPPPGGKPNTKPRDHGTPNFTTIELLCFIMCECLARLETHGNSMELRPKYIWLHITLENPWPHYMVLEVSWDGIWTLLLGSHNVMVTAPGSYVKWPLHICPRCLNIIGKILVFPSPTGYKLWSFNFLYYLRYIP